MTDYGYSYETGHTAKSYTKTPRTVRGITIHHWGSTGQKFDDVIAWFCGPTTTAKTSAHYVAQGANADGSASKRVACIVDPDLIAWQAGVWQANVDTIGIECRPEARDADYAVIAEVVARLWITYGILPLYPHNHWVSTTCPGKYDLAKIKNLATAKMAALKAPTPAPAPTPPKPPTPVSVKGTTVSLATTPSAVGSRQEVVVQAAVSPPAALGQVVFEWNNAGAWTAFATVTAVNGRAAVTNRPSATVTYRAHFIPTDAKAYTGGYSPSVTVQVVNLAQLAADVAALKKA